MRCSPRPVLPAEAVGKLNTLVNAYLKSDKGRADLARFGMESGGGTPADLKTFMASRSRQVGADHQGGEDQQRLDVVRRRSSQ